MINSFLLIEKGVISCDLKTLDAPNQEEEITGEIKTSISLPGDEKIILKKGQLLNITSNLKINAKKTKDNEVVFEFNIVMSTLFKAKKKFIVEEDFSKVNKVEILSFVYDDIKQIMDYLVNQTSYRGISIPFDFREVVD